MTPAEQFLTMKVTASRVDVDDHGNLVRIETRRCSRTGLTLTRTAPITPDAKYLSAH